MSNTAATATVYLKDYTVPAFLIPEVELDISLFEDDALVRSKLVIARNRGAARSTAPLVLDIDELIVESIILDGLALKTSQYTLDDRYLTLSKVPDAFELVTVCRIYPKKNTKLMGIYASSTGFFSLCEAEGFRRITPFLDRPDVMARYTVSLHADRERYPVLLANGNLIAQGEEAESRHWATWKDPFPKPSYLFAIVAARLDRRADTFLTRSGRKVLLQFFVEPRKLDQGTFALEALKKAMKWDEKTYGLEVDLDQYNVVAVGDFNAGATGKKGLNVFNTKLVLARPDISTDFDFSFIDRTVAHEYFHNWTGNRVTCRDWFQLSLKEGLTVFRDQEFSADQGSRAVRRIGDVRILRAMQFPEDDGPLAHPVRPDSYIRIDNFYTPTVYNKGAELVRMIHTLLGRAGFRRGMDLYIRRHDNQAVTIEDFVAAMQDASGVDLGQFKRWYEQAGRPEITIEDRWDKATKSYELSIAQKAPPTPGQAEKLPMLIPLAMGLLGPDGAELRTRLEDEAESQDGTRVITLAEARESFRFVDVPGPPVPSLLRGFSAPVKLKDVPLERLKFLAINDPEPFARWEAGQQVATYVLLDGIEACRSGVGPAPLDPDLVTALRRILADAERDPAFAAEALTLPSEAFLADQVAVVDVDAIHATRESARVELGRALSMELASAYVALADTGPYQIEGAAIGRRALRNTCLAYIAAADAERGATLARAQFESRANMTDVLAALTVLADLDRPERPAALARFYANWSRDELVIDKWFALQARSSLPGTPDRVRELTMHPAFERKNPNRVRALVGAFAQGNQIRFHDASGAGYAFLADEVITLDPINPTTAARLVQPLGAWRRHNPARQALMQRQLERVLATPELSKNTYEVVSKSLA